MTGDTEWLKRAYWAAIQKMQTFTKPHGAATERRRKQNDNTKNLVSGCGGSLYESIFSQYQNKSTFSNCDLSRCRGGLLNGFGYRKYRGGDIMDNCLTWSCQLCGCVNELPEDTNFYGVNRFAEKCRCCGKIADLQLFYKLELVHTKGAVLESKLNALLFINGAKKLING